MLNKQSIGTREVIVLFVMLVAFLFFSLSFLVTFADASNVIQSSFGTLGLLGGVFLLSLILAFFINKLKPFNFLCLLLVIGGVLRLFWIIRVDTHPVSDFQIMYQAAVKVAQGDFTVFTNHPYYERWPYQVGFTLYQAGVIKLFGDSLFVLKFFNIMFSLGTAVIVYYIARALFNEFCGKMASLMYVFYIPFIIMCSVLTNQHLSTFFYALGVYFATRPTVKHSWLYIGLCFGIGNLIRPLGSFYIGLLIVYFVFLFCLPSMRSERKQWIKKVLGVLAVYLILQQIVTFGYAVARIAPYPLPNNEPYWKFVTGLNVSTNGKFSKADNEYVHQFPLGEERNQAELQLIKERLQNKSELLKLFSSKFDEMWGGGDMSTFWSMDNTAQKSWRIYFDGAERIMYLFAIGLSCVSVAYSIRSNNQNYAHFFLLLIILGYAALHLVIEIQTRYRHDIIPFIFAVGSMGIQVIYQCLIVTKASFSRDKTESPGINQRSV